jgi:hypothetical protein
VGLFHFLKPKSYFSCSKFLLIDVVPKFGLYSTGIFEITSAFSFDE